MISGLGVAPGLVLPSDFVTQSAAILAVRRAGKSNCGVTIAEKMYAAGLPFAVIDPKGDWWGMRSDADGTGPGLPIPVFGGLHGDMPLTPESGRLIAEIIVTENLTCILDVSRFPSDAARARFLVDLGTRLFDLHQEHPQPRHIFLEECDDYIPQSPMGEQAKCVHTWTRIVKQGGFIGLGITLISQRSAVVNKNALTQIETLFAMRTTSPQDRKVIRDWLAGHVGAADVVDSLPGLQSGEAWVISPHWLTEHGQPAVQRVRFHRRSTFDSGATPTMETATRPPATLADIDLGAIIGRMEAVAEQAANDDPVALRKRIASLEKRLAAMPATRQDDEAARLREQVRDLTAALDEERARPPVRIEVPVVLPGDVAAFEQAIAAARDMAGSLELAISRATTPARVQPAGPKAARKTAPEPSAAPRPDDPAPVPPADGAARPLKAGAREMLGQLARHHPLRLTRAQLAALAGIKGSGSTFGSYFSALRINGLVEQDGAFVVVTPEGLAAAGVAAGAPPPTPEEIRTRWRSALKAGARGMLDRLLERYPEPVSRADLASLAGINPVGSTLGSYLSTLRSNNLIVEDGNGIRAADVFFLAEAGSDAG